MIQNTSISVQVSEAVIQEIYATIGKIPPEAGGILGAGRNGVISHYYFDHTGICSENGYTPDVETINHLLSDVWMPNDILMVGIVHSHAAGLCVPSCGDIHYGIQILQALDTVEEFLLPILTIGSAPELHFFTICRNSEQQFICRKTDYVTVIS